MELPDYKPRCDDGAGNPVQAPGKWRFLDCNADLVTLFYGDFSIPAEDQMEAYVKELATGVTTCTLLDIWTSRDPYSKAWNSVVKFLGDESYTEIKLDTRDEAIKHATCLAKAWTPALVMMNEMPSYDCENPPKSIKEEASKQSDRYHACMSTPFVSSASTRSRRRF